MDLAADLTGRVAGALGIAAAVTLLLWNADRRLPRQASAPFAAALSAGRPASADAARAFSAALLTAGIANPRPAGLLAHLARSALGCLVVAAILWAMATPRLPAGLLAEADALARLAGRLVASGLVTVFLVLWAAAAVIGGISARIARATPLGVLGFALLDLAVRLTALVAVTAATFALYARAAGSFGGSSATALSVVPETLMAALRLEGLSGVYVWGALLGGFPLALVLLARLSALPAPWRGLARLAPFRHRPARALGTVLGLAAGALALALSLALGIARPGGP
jgi:hypothetical protein